MLGPSAGPVKGMLLAVETDKSLVRLTSRSNPVNASQIDVVKYFAEFILLHAFLRDIEIPPREIRYIINPDIIGATVLTQG
jgi:hypothetical protein